jgi:hypothetical protein
MNEEPTYPTQFQIVAELARHDLFCDYQGSHAKTQTCASSRDVRAWCQPCLIRGLLRPPGVARADKFSAALALAPKFIVVQVSPRRWGVARQAFGERVGDQPLTFGYQVLADQAGFTRGKEPQLARCRELLRTSEVDR